jgi:hypothetical protein
VENPEAASRKVENQESQDQVLERIKRLEAKRACFKKP